MLSAKGGDELTERVARIMTSCLSNSLATRLCWDGRAVKKYRIDKIQFDKLIKGDFFLFTITRVLFLNKIFFSCNSCSSSISSSRRKGG